MQSHLHFLFLLILISLTAGKNAIGQSGKVQAPDSVLKANRLKIDSLDAKLIEVLGAREQAVKAIGIYKAKYHIPSLQSARFQEVVDQGIKAGKEEGLSSAFITELFNAIHKESLKLEDDIKARGE